MLRWRLLLGTLIIAALVGLCWLDQRSALPGLWLFPVGLILTLLASDEILSLSRAGGLRPLAWAVYGGNVLILSAGWFGSLVAHAHHAPSISAEQSILVSLGLAFIALIAGEMARYVGPGGVTANLGAAMLALVYVGVLMAILVMLRMAWGIGAIVSMIVVVKMGDTGAYTFGRLFGRHKMAPTLSPGKTLEGALGGMLLAVIGSWVAFGWIVPMTSTASATSGPRWGWLVYGLLVASAGLLGDLAESLVKRDVGRKDSSDWMPGFGGVLDIIDSLLLAAPVAYGCWAMGLVPTWPAG